MSRAFRSMAFDQAIAALNRNQQGRARRLLSRAIVEPGAHAGWACQRLIQSYWQRGEAAAAVDHLRRLLAPAAPLLDWSLGYLGRRTGAALALERLERAVAARPRILAAEIELAAALARSDPKRSGTLLRRAAAAAQQAGDVWAQAAIAVQRASIATERQDLDGALELCATATELKERAGLQAGVALVCQIEAKALYRLTEFNGAMAALQRALQIHRQTGNLLEAGVLENNIGLWHLELSRPDHAATAFAAARRSFRRIGDSWREAAVLANLAGAHHQRGSTAASLRTYEACLELLAKGPGDDAFAIALAEMAEAATASGRPRLALTVLDRLPAARRRRLAATTRCQLDGERVRAWLALGSLRPALRTARASRRRAESLPAPRPGQLLTVVRTRYLEARAELATGSLNAATATLQRCANEVSELLAGQSEPAVRMDLVETLRAIDDERVTACLLADDGEGRRAANLLATIKARELTDPVHPPTADRRRHTRARGRSRPCGSVGSRSPSRPRLDPATMVIDYHVHRDGTRALVSWLDRLRVVDLPCPPRRLIRDIARLLEPLRAVATSDDPLASLLEFDLALAHRLYQSLLAPCLAVTPVAIEHLRIIPDGPLHGLPFELLVAHRPPPASAGASSARAPLRTFDHSRYVGDTLTVSYALSRDLVDVDARGWPATPRTLLTGFSPVAGATLATPQGPLALATLPGVDAELSSLQSLLGHPVDALSGAAATPDRFAAAAPTADLIHIAAHARADVRNPSLAGIVLAPSDPHATIGFLSAARIRDLDLQARLVTLSACDTGHGRRLAREGALGLARAFLEAGARAVLASSWPVDDDATRALMVGLYRRLVAGQPPAQALTRAKRELRYAIGRQLHAERAHPFFWASFVLIDHGAGRGNAN